MVFATMLGLSTLLTFNVNYYSDSNGTLLRSYSVNPSYSVVDENDLHRLTFNSAYDISPLQYYNDFNTEDIREISFIVYCNTSGASGSSTIKLFDYTLYFSDYDDQVRCYILSSTENFGVYGYGGEGNLIIDSFTCSVVDEYSQNTLTYRNSFYNYIYYDNFADGSNFTGLSSYRYILDSPMNVNLSLSLMPLSEYERIAGAISDNSNWSDGYDTGYSTGYDTGNLEGYNNGYDTGKNDGYSEGYTLGYQNGVASQVADYGFMDLFSSIADTPILMFRSLFNFDLFGVPLISVVLSLFTSVLLIFFIKKLIK